MTRGQRPFGTTARLIVVVFRLNTTVRILFLLSSAAYTRWFLSRELERDFETPREGTVCAGGGDADGEDGSFRSDYHDDSER